MLIIVGEQLFFKPKVMNQKIKKIFLSILFLSTTFLYAQNGFITGTVNDGDLNDVLPFANVIIKNLEAKGTTTDFEGKFNIELPPGTYTVAFSFVGYQTKEITDVVVNANNETFLSTTLYPSANQLDEVVITTTARRNTEQSVLNLQKQSVSQIDGLSIESINKSGASNLASAVRSVPGVSVEGGKYVYVRGLGDRYTKTILNGVDIPGLDPDRNSIQMDLFPTEILENVIVVKSASASYPADFTGGIVDIQTKDFPAKPTYSLSFGFGVNPDMNFNSNFLQYDGSNTDILGFDDGTRDVPISRGTRIPGTFEQFPNEDVHPLTELTNQFEKQLVAETSTSMPNFNFNFTAGNQYDVGDDKLGYQFSLSYDSNTIFYENREDGNFLKDQSDNTNLELSVDRITLGNEGINSVVLNGLAGIAYKRDNAKYRLNILHIQNGESSAGLFNQTFAEGGSGSAGLANLRKDALLYTERSISNIYISGKHNFENDWDLEWKVSPTLAVNNDKDHRVTILEVNQQNNLSIRPNSAGFPIRIWRSLEEVDVVAKADIDKKLEVFERSSNLKFGANVTLKSRDFSIDDYRFTSTSQIVPDNNPNAILFSENVWNPTTNSGTHLLFADEFEPNNAFDSEQRTFAGYGELDFKPLEKLKAVIGLRFEKFESYYTGQTQGDPNDPNTQIFNNDLILDKSDFFPSANLIYELTEKTNLRASYSRTTARPSFKEASFVQIFDPIPNRTFIGNLDLQPTYVNNIDLRYEFFGGEGELLALSGFYKDFTDPIELTFFESAPSNLTPRNLGNAEVYGIELEFRKRLGFISEGLKNLKFNFNLSLIESSLTMFDAEFNRRVLAAREGETISREREFQGQAPYLINGGLDYTNDELGLQAGFFYNVQGETLEVVGDGIVPDVFTQPFHSLDFKFRKAFGENKNKAISVRATNILADEKESIYKSFGGRTAIFFLREPFRTFSINYTYKF